MSEENEALDKKSVGLGAAIGSWLQRSAASQASARAPGSGRKCRA
ncbi:hypothetical protein [Paenibacillus sp. FSL L8-0709]